MTQKSPINFEFDVRIPDALVRQMMDGEITCAMLTTMTILYKWANWSTGRVKWVSSGGLRTASHKAYSDRTFRISLQRLEEMGWITRHMVPGSLKDYAVTINNYKVVDDAGKVRILNPKELKVSDPFAVMPCREGSQETSQKDLLNLLPEILPDHKPEPLPDNETKKVSKKPLASLAEVGEASQPQKQDKTAEALSPQAEEKKRQPQEPEPDELHPGCWSIRRIWQESTGHILSWEDMALAHKLIVTYRYRAVGAVLRNTLWTRPKSAKLRWNKFSVFAKHWERNHEEYLAWIASNPKTTHAAVQKFDPVPGDDEIDQKEWNGLTRWMTEHKIGDWTFERAEWEKMGFTYGQVYTAMLYCGEEGIGVTRDKFISLLLEVAGGREPGAEFEFKGMFDEEEA